MSVFKPFKAWRPKPELAQKVASKPYDVLSSDEARKEAEGNELSFLHVGKPEIELSADIDIHSEIVYQTAKKNLDKYIENNIIVEDTTPNYYIYAQTMNGRTQYGFVGLASVDDYWNDVIKKHEKTRKDKEEDRANHVRYTSSHSGPIFLTFPDNPELQSIINKVVSDNPNTDIITDDGIHHQVWVVSDKQLINQIQTIFANTPNLYVADGHHRSAAAAIVGRERQLANPNHKGDEEYNFFLAVAFPASHLYIMDYNRLVKDLNGLSTDEFIDKLKVNFAIEQSTKPVKPSKKGEFGMYLYDKWYKLTANDNLLNITDPIEKLDVSILQKYVLSNILGIDDPRTDKRIDFVGGIRGLQELERRVNSKEMVLAFSLFPTSINELIDIADAGKIMPPKSTWFEPKLRDGLFIHFF